MLDHAEDVVLHDFDISRPCGHTQPEPKISGLSLGHLGRLAFFIIYTCD
jgi:hypothetical protein